MWMRRLFVWENSLVQELIVELESGHVKLGMQDEWRWKLDLKCGYSMKATYNILNYQQNSQKHRRLELIWDDKNLLKFSALVWKTLQNQLPTKDNLIKRKVVLKTDDVMCVQCNRQVESTNNLFFSCKSTWVLWTGWHEWWNLKVAAYDGLWGHFLQHWGLVSKGILGDAWNIVWFVVIWSIWLWRNQKVFLEEADDIDKVMGLIKFRSYSWIKAWVWPDLSLDLWGMSPKESFEAASLTDYFTGLV